jgi:hypothetical protein
MEACEVVFGRLVGAGGDPSPCLECVDQSFDGVPFLVEIGVVADGPAASCALLPALGCLVLLLWDDRFDVSFAQVGAVAAGRVGLVCGNSSGPGAGAADGQADPYLF